MSKTKKGSMAMIVFVLVMLMAAPAFAKSISFKDAGIGLWIFIIIGAVIVFLQLIPAAVLFFSFVGTTTSIVLGGKKREAEEVEVTVGLKPTPVKK